MARKAERAADLLADHDAAHRRRQHQCGAQMADPFGEGGTERLGVARPHQHQRALQITGAMEPRGQLEMPFEQRARLAEQGQHVVFSHRAVV